MLHISTSGQAFAPHKSYQFNTLTCINDFPHGRAQVSIVLTPISSLYTRG